MRLPYDIAMVTRVVASSNLDDPLIHWLKPGNPDDDPCI